VKLVTWNINGIRARETAMLGWIDAHLPDILFLQEVKAATDQIPASIQRLSGYRTFWNPSQFKAGYSGVGALIRETLVSKLGNPSFSIPNFDVENRLVEISFPTLTLLGGYFPRGEKPDHYALKLKFFQSLTARAADLMTHGNDVVIAGDINVAHRELDLHPSQQKDDATGFRPEERKAIDALLAVGLRDVFRDLHPDEAGLYSWFPYWKGARERNLGWRIDCIYASPKLAALAVAGKIHADEKSSDHYPVSIEFNL